MQRIGSNTVLQMRRTFLTVLLALMLAPAVAAGFPELPEFPEAPELPEAPEQPPTFSDSAPEEAKPVTQTLDDLLARAWAESQEARDEVERIGDVDQLRREIDGHLGTVQTTADGLQEEIGTLLAEDESEPQPEESEITTAAVSTQFEMPPTPILLMAGTALGLGMLAWFIGQSATVGAGAATTAAARDGRKFLPLASPLFTRFEKDTVLGHPKREAIYGEIIGQPGITLQDLCETTGLSRTAVTHHLRLMEQQHLIVSKRMGRSRHFFENGGRYGREQKEAYAVLHNDRSKEIHDHIQTHPGAIQKDLCEKFEIQASVAHWHVKRLLDAKLIEAVRQGRTVSYFAQRVDPSYT